MSVHWKFGEGFAIRYGGYRDIQWFFDESMYRGAAGVGLPPLHPLAIAVEAVKAGALLLQWWELRKQTMLQSAAFEERRIPWLVDMLAQWSTEMSEHKVLRLDTIFYLDRELTRLFEKLQSEKRMDVPSSLLLQLDRAANTLVGINRMLDALAREGEPNFVLVGGVAPGSQKSGYRPYFEFENDSAAETAYVNGVTASMVAIRTFGFAGLVAPIPILLGVPLLWTIKQLLAAAEHAEQQRMEGFAAVRHLALEVRSCNALLRAVQLQPGRVKSFSPTAIERGEPGEVTLLEAA